MGILRIGGIILGTGLLLGSLTAAEHGFPNIARTLPAPVGGMPRALFIRGPIAPQQGRAAIVAWHGERIVSVPEGPGSQSGADLRVRIIDINDPANPVIETKPYSSSGFNAHGYFHYGPYLYIGPHDANPPNGMWRDSFFTNGPGSLLERNMEEDAGLFVSTYTRSGAQSPFGAEMWWSYNAVEGNAFLAIRRTAGEWVHDWAGGSGAATGPGVKATWDHLGQTGVVGMPFIIGNILIYAAENTGTGVATYDISNPANPVLLDVLKDRNPGGYWPEIYGHYIFFPRRENESGPNARPGFMVVDYSDPTNLRIVAEREIEGSNQYVTFQDEFAFMNRSKIDMRTFEKVMDIPASDGGVSNNGGPNNVDASQFTLPVGNLVITGGYGEFGPGIGIWAHQAAPDTRPPFVAYHIPRPDQTNYPLQCPLTFSIPETLKTETIISGTTLIVRPVGGAPVACWHSFGQGKLLTVTPRVPLTTNTTYEVVLQNIADAAGNLMEPYSFRFSTGAGLAGGNQPPVIASLTAATSPAAPAATITFTVAASDPNGDALQYRLDYGDGSAKTPWQSGTGFARAYASAGHYSVSVQARDPGGMISSFSRGVTVISPLAGTRPTNSSMIALGADARRVWVVHPDGNTLAAINADTQAKVWEQPTGADPRGVARGGDGSLWIACHDADRVDVLSGTTGALITSIATGYGSGPIGICASPDGATIYVSCTGDGTLRRMSVTGRNQTGALTLGPTPRAIAITGTGQRALVTRFISGEHEGSVYDVNLAGAMSLTRTIRLGRHWLIDSSANGRGVPNYLAGITITPDNTRAWVVGKKDNTERGTFMSSTLRFGQDNTVRAQLVVIDLATNAEDPGLRMDIDNSDSPTAVAFSPQGDYAFIALQGNNQIGIVDHLDFVRGDSPKGLISRLGTGLAPQGAVFDATTGRLFVQNFMGRNVTAVEMTSLLSAGSLNLATSTIATQTSEMLTAPVVQGKRVFYNAGDTRMSAEGYISCATCHADGGHDGRTWDFTQRGEGMRNTTDLRGRSGTGHGAVHWTANFDEIQDFEHDIRNEFGGTGFLSDADFATTGNPLGEAKAGRSIDLDALAAYVTSLGDASLPKSPVRQTDGANTASANAGRLLFTQENCASCHVPTSGFTDRQLHDVGTLRVSSGGRIGGALTGIDTPTLLGLHASAPYFHDGSATTLDDVFTIAGGNLQQAESGTLVGGALIDSITWSAMKNWRKGLFVALDANGKGVSFSSINGGSGGAGMIEVRYSVNYGSGNLQVVVNGAVTNVVLPSLPNEPSYMPVEWRIMRVPVTYAAGTANTVIVRRGTGGGVISLDEVLISTPVHFSLAQAHRRVLSLTSSERGALMDYLRQLDASDVGELVPVPEIAVSRGATPISDGGIDTAPAGVLAVPQVLTYAIANTGTAALTLGGFSATSVSGCTVLITAQPAATLGAGTSATFSLTVTPTASSWSFALSSGTNDSDEHPTNWTVAGTAAPTPAPEIAVSRGATPVADGGVNAAPAGVIDVAQTLTYGIANVGSAILTLGGFSVSGATGCDVTITTPAATPVAVGASTNLVLSVTPTAPTWTFALSTVTNDGDENPTNWTVMGTATPAPAPEIAVSRAAITIADGGTDTVATGTIGTGRSLTYTIANTGTMTLTMGGFAITDGAGCAVTVTSAAATSVAAGSTTALTVSVTPTAETWSFGLVAVTNDADENPIDWTVAGSADPSGEDAESPTSAAGGAKSCGFGSALAVLMMILLASFIHSARRQFSHPQS